VSLGLASRPVSNFVVMDQRARPEVHVAFGVATMFPQPDMAER
jgi:hypothetical protein